MKNEEQSKSTYLRIMLMSVIIALIMAGCVSTVYKPDASSINQRKLSVEQSRDILKKITVWPNTWRTFFYPAGVRLQWDGIEFVFQKSRPQGFSEPYICKFNKLDPAVQHWSGADYPYVMLFDESGKHCNIVTYWHKSEDAMKIADIVYILKTSVISAKVGWFDVATVIKESDIGIKAVADFRKIYAEKQARIKERESELKTRKNDLAKKRSHLNEQTIKEMDADYQHRFKQYEKLVHDSNIELKQLDMKLSQQIIPQVMIAAERIKKEEEYIAINPIVKNNTESPKGDDITKKVIEELNRFTKMREQHLARAGTMESQGRYREAINELSNALMLATGETEKLIRRRMAALYGRHSRSIGIPREAEDHVQKARVLIEEVKKYDKAAAEFKEAIRIAPYVAGYYYNLAATYDLLKDYRSAIRYMEIYTDIAPDAPDAKEARSMVIRWKTILEEKGR